ncbi:FAD/NAD(P)-binding domain-containing protein [Imleria badia]|nr:FAD/NAD(P)-binding domain-containing protein [Imleria badia]
MTKCGIKVTYLSAVPSPSESTPKFRVAICGAGIGGLVLAITIGKYDPSMPVDLYEGRDSIDTGGVGIIIAKKTHEVLIELGLFDEFKQISTYDLERSRSPKIRRSDIREGGYHWFHRPDHHELSPMHHQDIIVVLQRHLPPSCTVHSKKRLVNYMEPEEVDAHSTSSIRLEFTDGTTATTDVLIGADGIRSVVRKTMFEAASNDNEDGKTDLKQYIDATFTGMSVYRALISAETLGKENPENASLRDMIMYSGKGRSLVTYPIAKGSIINVAAFVCDPSSTGTHFEGRWVSDATRDELVEHFDDFEPDVRTVLELCEKPTKWALHVVKPLPFCARNRVALVGDACHAMTNHFGAGTVQAIDDAFILGRLIAHPLTPLSRVHDALRIYEEIRLPVARILASLSLSTGWMYSFMAPGYYDGTRNEDDEDDCGIGSYEREGMEVLKQEILKGWNTLHESDSSPQAWVDAELKLQVLAGQIAN